MMDEVFQEQQERDNLSGSDDEAAWRYENKGCYQCPYCGEVYVALIMCCGEIHGQLIGDEK